MGVSSSCALASYLDGDGDRTPPHDVIGVSSQRTMTRRNREVVDSHGIATKIIPNLPIWGIKSELRGIMVNKGRIHREFRYFRDIFWNLVKLDNELR